MPPTFLYMLYVMGLVVWVVAAGGVLMLAAILAMFARARPTALRLAAATIATFPGVLAYQFVAAPAALILLVGGLFVVYLIAPVNPTHTTTDPVVIAVSIASILLPLGIGAVASIMGLWRGWRTGWALASGRDLVTATEGDPLVRIVTRIRRRVPHGRES